MRTKLKSLDSGSVVDKTFRAGEKMPRVHTETKSVQYLYDAGDEVVFMDESSFEQVNLPRADVADGLEFLQPSSSVMLLTVDGRPAGIQLPASVELAVVETEPGVKGDTVSNVTKAATLETGAVVQVPLFVNSGRPDQGRHARAPLHLARLGHLDARSRRHDDPAPLAGAARRPCLDITPPASSPTSSTVLGSRTSRSPAAAASTRAVRRGVESPWERIRALNARC